MGNFIINMQKIRLADADMWVISEGCWCFMCVCVCVLGFFSLVWGGGGLQLDVVQRRAAGFVTGTTELPAAPGG